VNMTRILALALVLAALVASASPAAAQAPKLDRLDPQTRSAVIAVIDSSVSAGLPVTMTQSLVSEAQRLRAFGQSSETIIRRVREQARRLQIARIALGDASVTDVEAGAAALGAGVEPATLAELRRARPRSSVAVALVVLADLITRGVPADTASGLILAVAGSQAGDQVWHELRTTVVQDISSGKTPLYAAEARTRGVLGIGAGSAAVTTDAETRGLPATTGGGRPASPPPPVP
jgi:hypothetical protein